MTITITIIKDSFDGFDKEKLLSTQKIYWKNVVPEITAIPIIPPSECIVLYLLQWTTDDSLRSKIYEEADAAVVDFLLDDTSMYYGPATIAVCALIIAFSTLDIEANDFLDGVVPKHFFCCGSGSTVRENIEEYDTCLGIFMKNSDRRKRKIKAYNEHQIFNDDMQHIWYSSTDETMNGLSSDSCKAHTGVEKKDCKIIFNSFLLMVLKLAKDDAHQQRLMEMIKNDPYMDNFSLNDFLLVLQA